MVIVAHFLSPAVAGDISRGYVPGSPGAAWTEEEVRVVQEKVGLATLSAIISSSALGEGDDQPGQG